MTGTFQIVTVCTGNVCRSPSASLLLEDGLRALKDRVSIRSAGTGALVGNPMEANALACLPPELQERGKKHTAQQLVQNDLVSSDLILALDRGHRKRILAINPRVKKKTFTLKEFARLGSVTSAGDLKAELLGKPVGDTYSVLTTSVHAARLSRNLVPVFTPVEEEDVVDPYQKEFAVFEQSFNDIQTAVKEISEFFLRAIDAEPQLGANSST